MSERTVTQGDVVYMGKKEFTVLMTRFIRSYKFMHRNELPAKIVLPPVMLVWGVLIEKEIGEIVEALPSPVEVASPEEEEVEPEEVEEPEGVEEPEEV